MRRFMRVFSEASQSIFCAGGLEQLLLSNCNTQLGYVASWHRATLYTPFHSKINGKKRSQRRGLVHDDGDQGRLTFPFTLIGLRRLLRPSLELCIRSAQIETDFVTIHDWRSSQMDCPRGLSSRTRALIYKGISNCSSTVPQISREL
jgi:hypothetical protein